MSSSGQVFLAALIGAPLAILVHELGHAMAGLRFTTEPVTVRVGQSQLRAHLKIGRLAVIVSPFACSGNCRAHGRFARRSALVFILAGVAANLLIAAVAVVLAFSSQPATRPAMLTFAAINALGISNLLPSYALTGRPLDGLRALRLLQSRPQPLLIAPRSGGLNWNLSAKDVMLMVPFIALVILLLPAFPTARYAFYALALQSLLSQVGTKRSGMSQSAA
jgi:hypothetical protein